MIPISNKRPLPEKSCEKPSKGIAKKGEKKSRLTKFAAEDIQYTIHALLREGKRQQCSCFIPDSSFVHYDPHHLYRGFFTSL
jgi:hypothetical protein